MGTILHLRQKLSHSKLMFSLCGEAGAVQYQHHLEDATQMAWRCWSQQNGDKQIIPKKAKYFKRATALPRAALKVFAASFSQATPVPISSHEIVFRAQIG